MVVKKKIFLIIFLTIILTFWLAYFFNKDLFELKVIFIYLEIIQDFISKNFFISFILFTLSYCFLTICNFPAASLLSLTGGFLFGTWFGGIGIIIGGTIGSFIVFIIAKSFFHDYISKNLLNKFTYIYNYFQKNDLELMFLIRLIPGIPFFAQNLILAGLGARRSKFFFTTLLGLSPWAIVLASIGRGLEEIFIEDQDLSFALIAKPEYLIPISIIALLVVVIMIFKKKYLLTQKK